MAVYRLWPTIVKKIASGVENLAEYLDCPAYSEQNAPELYKKLQNIFRDAATSWFEEIGESPRTPMTEFSYLTRSRPGQFHPVHYHTKADLIGVFYASVGSGCTNFGPIDNPLTFSKTPAALCLFDSNGPTRFYPDSQKAFFEILPEPGDIIIFPGSVPHFSNPFSEGVRCTITYNVRYQ